MIILLIGIISGLLGTVAMDFFARLIRKNIFALEGLQIVPVLLGRWLMNIIGTKKIFYSDIRQLSSKNNEVRFGTFAHYLIGLFLGVLFIFIRSFFFNFFEKSFLNVILLGIAYGLLTNILPWLIMYPSMGFGFFGQKHLAQKQLILFSCTNHLVYGVSLGLISNLLTY